jgi:hypothetical protein
MVWNLVMACHSMRRSSRPAQETASRRRDGDYSMADIGLSASSLFFMRSPPFLEYHRVPERGQGRSNCQTIGDPLGQLHPPDAGRCLPGGVRRPVYARHREARVAETLPMPERTGAYHAVWNEYFCSRKIQCSLDASPLRRSFHGFLRARMVAPGYQQVVTLPPAFIAPQDAPRSRTASAMSPTAGWVGALAHLRPIYLGDDLFACQSIATAIQGAGSNFILTCKLSSHPTITEYLHGATLEEYRQIVCERSRHTTTIYRWLSSMPLRGAAVAIQVNWFSIERSNLKQADYYNRFVMTASSPTCR